MEPPKQLLLPLLPYQKGFLGWAVNQEKGDIKGGILADEMGMGKTIQVGWSPFPIRTRMATRQQSLLRGYRKYLVYDHWIRMRTQAPDEAFSAGMTTLSNFLSCRPYRW